MLTKVFFSNIVKLTFQSQNIEVNCFLTHTSLYLIEGAEFIRKQYTIIPRLTTHFDECCYSRSSLYDFWSKRMEKHYWIVCRYLYLSMLLVLSMAFIWESDILGHDCTSPRDPMQKQHKECIFFTFKCINNNSNNNNNNNNNNSKIGHFSFTTAKQMKANP